MNNQNNSSAPDGDLFAAIMNLPSDVQSTVFASWTRAEQNAYCAGHRDARHAAAELVAEAEATQPLADRVQGGLTDAQIREIFLANGFTIKEGLSDLKAYVYQAARALERAILSRQSAIANEALAEHAHKALYSLPEYADELSRQSMMGGEARAANLLDSHVNYISSVLRSAPQEQAERPSHETIISEGGKLVCTACGTTTPANAAAANGDGLADSIEQIDFADAREFLKSWGVMVNQIPQIIDMAERAYRASNASAADADGQEGEAT